MKKTIFPLLLIVALTANGQLLNVQSIEPLNIQQQENLTTQAVAISPRGDYVLLSTDTKQGLVKWDLTTATASTLTDDEGAGSDVRICDDGQQIVYGEVTYKDKRRHQAVKAIDLSSGKKQTLVKATRHLEGFAVNQQAAVTITDGRLKTHALKKGADLSLTRPVLTRHHLKLYITRDGVTTMLAPNGADKRYIWGSLSPDGTRVLYYVSELGAFVCDVDGTHVIAMGELTAPRWWDDSIIVGMDETDDEYSIVSSRIVARSLDGQEQVLTGDDVIATYPLPSLQSGKIAFSTPDGRIYLINVK